MGENHSLHGGLMVYRNDYDEERNCYFLCLSDWEASCRVFKGIFGWRQNHPLSAVLSDACSIILLRFVWRIPSKSFLDSFLRVRVYKFVVGVSSPGLSRFY